MKRTIVRAANGERLAVIRPRTTELAELAVSLATVAERHADDALFQRNPAEVADYVFAVYQERDPRTGRQTVVDRDGRHVGELMRGDSFVEESALARFSRPD